MGEGEFHASAIGAEPLIGIGAGEVAQGDGYA
jgi:hypothetical protein